MALYNSKVMAKPRWTIAFPGFVADKTKSVDNLLEQLVKASLIVAERHFDALISNQEIALCMVGLAKTIQ